LTRSTDSPLVCNDKKGFSVGEQEEWGWFRHLNTTSERAWDMVIFTDWHKIFKDLCAQDDPTALSADDSKFQKAMEKNALATFIDAHNTSYYVNAYTTKVNPTMDDVLSKLLDGVRRLRDEWQDREAQAQGDSHDGETPLDAPRDAKTLADRKRKEDFKRTLQVLSRFETCFRRASWKSGCEMVFPMLFGHLAFMTHRCWKIFMRKAIYLAAEAWRREYGQLETKAHIPDSSITYTLPGSDDAVIMRGWSQVQRDDRIVYIGPEGDEYDCIEYAHQAFEDAKKQGGSLRAVTKALQAVTEGAAEEDPVPRVVPVHTDSCSH